MILWDRGAMSGLECDGDRAQGDADRGCKEWIVFDQVQTLPRSMRRVARQEYGWKYKRWNGKMYDFCRWHSQKYRG